MEKPLETWVFLRGAGRGSGHWGEFPLLFQKHFPHAKVYCLDIPGNGERCGEQSFLKVSPCTDSLRALLKQKGSGSEPIYILGISFGGMITLDWMSRYPEEIHAAVVINTSAGRLSRPWKRLQLPVLKEFLKIGLAKTAVERESLVLALTANDPARRKKLLPGWAEQAGKFPIHPRNAIRQLVAAATFSLPETPPTRPALVIVSEKDRIVDPSCSRRLAEEWDFPIKTHTKAGHDLPIDDPEWLLAAIAEWRVTLG